MPMTYPDSFFEVRVTHLELPGPMATLCAGFEGGAWRAPQLADHLFQWLPYAALNQEQQLDFGKHNFVDMLRIACSHIYKTKKTSTRGELGELLLHLACVLHFKTVPVMCKLILKTSSNDTVKGFDGVHLLVSEDAENFEIWLGESKFYTDAQEAVRDAVKSVRDHILPTFLNTEKAMIIGHIAPNVPHRDAVVRLFKSQTSSDDLIKNSVFPILVTYESSTVAAYTALCEEYVTALKNEAESLKVYFYEKANGLTLRFQLVFVPIKSKEELVGHFDKKLEAFL